MPTLKLHLEGAECSLKFERARFNYPLHEGERHDLSRLIVKMTRRRNSTAPGHFENRDAYFLRRQRPKAPRPRLSRTQVEGSGTPDGGCATELKPIVPMAKSSLPRASTTWN